MARPGSDPDELLDFERLDSVERIACLANEHRLAILGELVRAPRTGAQVAQALGLTAQLAHYHLKRLLEHGFVVEVPVEASVKGRSSERFYRARARQLFVDPGLACRDDATARALVASFEQVLQEWQRREVLGVDLAAVARRVVGDGLELGAGERILIVAQPQVREIVDRLYIEAECRGARPRLRPWSGEYALARLDRMEALSEADRQALQFSPHDDLDELSAVVHVTSTQPGAPPPSATQRKLLPHLLDSLGEWLRAARARGVRHVELSVPARGDLEHGELSVREATALFWDALQVPPATLAVPADALLDAVRDAADDAGRAELVLEDESGSTLRVLVDAENAYRSLGRLTHEDARAGVLTDGFPPGSVAWLPIAGTATGTLRMPYVVLGPTRFFDLRLTLADGHITAIEGEGAAQVRERIDAAAGDAGALAEVRIGVNPAGDRTTGKASLDGVLAGTVALAFGSNEVLGGTQRATLDLRFPSRALALAAGGRTLAAGGRLVVGG